MIKNTHTRTGNFGMHIGGLFGVARTVGDLEKECEKLLSDLKGNCKEKDVKVAVDKILECIGSSNRREPLHNAKIDVDKKEIKLKRFARKELKLVLDDIESQLNNITEKGTKDLGLWKDNENKLKKIIKSAQEQQKQNYDRSNSDNSSNSGEHDNIEKYI